MRGEALPTVSVIGLGYIGLPTAAIIARAGMQVRGVDVSEHVVETINRGAIHIEEADLDGLVHAVVQRGLLSAATEVAPEATSSFFGRAPQVVWSIPLLRMLAIVTWVVLNAAAAVLVLLTPIRDSTR